MIKIDEIKKYAQTNNVPIMLDDGLKFLLDYVRENQIKNILECGTAIGYSAINMAKIDPTIKIDTLEINPSSYEKAKENVLAANLQAQISLYLTDCLAFETEKIYDLIFIDAAKAQYEKYMLHFMKNTHDNTVFVFDNLNFHGMVDDLSLTSNRNTRQLVGKIKRFRDKILHDEAYKTEFFPNIGDGIAILKVNPIHK